MNTIWLNPHRQLSDIDRNIFGGFAEHLGRCIYGGIYEPGSHLADPQGFRQDILTALKRLNMPVIRYPGGSFVAAYRWRDGVGPRDQRPTRADVAWNSLESNTFGTDEFIQFCRKVGADPYLTINTGDGGLREARDWLEYCNGTQETDIVKLRHANGYEDPHNVRYWGIGNEVDGPWDIGYKSAEDYARIFSEYSRYMRMVDPSIVLIASVVSSWHTNFVERTQLLIEQAGPAIDYLALHWYVGNRDNDFDAYMTTSELIDERLTAYEGLIDALCLNLGLRERIPIAVDEWNVWYRTMPEVSPMATPFEFFKWAAEEAAPQEPRSETPIGLEEIYNLEDALVVAMHLNAFIRHAQTVRMANIAQIVNAIAPILTSSDGLVLQTIFYPLELYSTTCGPIALDVYWEGETFSGGDYHAVRLLDVSATLNEATRELVVYVVNRHQSNRAETEIVLNAGAFLGNATIRVVNGLGIHAENNFDSPDSVGTQEATLPIDGTRFRYAFEPHSVTAIICSIQ
ncbi:MAG: alpha-N-arabinofuranosidase [Chloroflexi bacterium]|nr:alpha-N-arabinofuranosidase [Chloroflexota bacterium]